MTTPTQATPAVGAAVAIQKCINPDCAAEFSVRDVLVCCPKCGELLDVQYDWSHFKHRDWSWIESRGATFGPRDVTGRAGRTTTASLDFSGVWRFRELMPFYEDERRIVTIGEGRTNLQRADALADKIGFDLDAGGALWLEYEGFNPSGSFKDNGMTAAFTHATMVGAKRVACASTGNTSASLAMYASLTGMDCYVFIGEGKIAFGKLSQALDFGCHTLQVAGDFDACLKHVRDIAQHHPELGVYLMNSLNPFRLEGQKAIMFRILEGMNWRVPDWVVCPGGNLGNSSAFGKAFAELHELGLIDRVPRIAIINATGARTLDRVVNDLGVRWNGGRYDREKVKAEYERMDREHDDARTVASAIEINRPVNLAKALRTLETTNGVVRSYSDEVIVEHKALVGHYGYGCEPASGASVAGAHLLLEEGIIKPTDTVACVLTGHQLKDPDVTVKYHTGIDMKAAQARVAGDDIPPPTGTIANRPIRVPDDLKAIIDAMT